MTVGELCVIVCLSFADSNMNSCPSTTNILKGKEREEAGEQINMFDNYYLGREIKKPKAATLGFFWKKHTRFWHFLLSSNLIIF